jgi:hypothetical protein
MNPETSQVLKQFGDLQTERMQNSRKKQLNKSKQNNKKEEEMKISSSKDTVSTRRVEDKYIDDISKTITFFISYSHNDIYETRIQEIADFLKGRGHRVIRDKTDFRLGDPIGKSVQTNFFLANCVLFLVTREYQDKILKEDGYCYYEWKLTHNSETHIYFPIILDPTMTQENSWEGDFGNKLRDKGSFDASAGSDLSGLNEVLKKAKQKRVDLKTANVSGDDKTKNGFPIKASNPGDGCIQFFLSSSQAPEKYDEKIETITKLLEGKGHRVIRDKTHFPPNTDIGKSIQKHFLSSHCVMFLVTKEYHDKVNLLKNEGGCDEWELTHNSEAHIYFSIILDSTMRDPKLWEGDFGDKLRDKLFVDASGSDLSKLEAVIEEAKQKLARPADNAVPSPSSGSRRFFWLFAILGSFVLVDKFVGLRWLWCRHVSPFLPPDSSLQLCSSYCNSDSFIQSQPFCGKNYCANFSALELENPYCEEFCEGPSKYESQCYSYCEIPSVHERPFCRKVNYCNDTQFQSRQYCDNYCDDPEAAILLPECKTAVTIGDHIIRSFNSTQDIISLINELPSDLMDDATANALVQTFGELSSKVDQFFINNQIKLHPNLSDDLAVPTLNPNFSKALRDDVKSKDLVVQKMNAFREKSVELQNEVVSAYQNGKYETVLVLIRWFRDVSDELVTVLEAAKVSSEMVNIQSDSTISDLKRIVLHLTEFINQQKAPEEQGILGGLWQVLDWHSKEYKDAVQKQESMVLIFILSLYFYLTFIFIFFVRGHLLIRLWRQLRAFSWL